MQRLALLSVLFAAACTAPGTTITPESIRVAMQAKKASAAGGGAPQIVGGAADTGDPSVVLMIAQVPNSMEASLCTAEVITPHVLLTAAHCVDPATVGTGNQFAIFTGDDLNNTTEAMTDSNFIAVKSTVFNPGFDTNNLTGGNDTGVLITADPLPLSTLPVNQTALDNSSAGSTLRFVGYGRDGANDSTSGGTKRQVSIKLTDVTTDGKFLEFGSHSSNVCEGDSGGPAFLTIGGVETIVGITSFGGTTCTSTSDDTNIGFYWSSWVVPQITAAGDTAPAPGVITAGVDAGTTTMPTSTNDLATGTTVIEDMSTTTPPTSPVDAATSTTPPTTNTTGNAVGTPCTDSSQCMSGICTEGSSRFCTETCDLTNANSCPSGTHCADVGNAPYCVLTQHSGCSAAPTSGNGGGSPLPAAALLLLGSFALLRRRIRLLATSRR